MTPATRRITWARKRAEEIPQYLPARLPLIAKRMRLSVNSMGQIMAEAKVMYRIISVGRKNPVYEIDNRSVMESYYSGEAYV